MKKQEEIKFLLHTHGIKYSWLADKLGIKKQTLSYILNESPNVDDDLYNQIIKILEEYQFELDLFENPPPDTLDLFSDEKLRVGIGERIRIFAKRKYGTLKSLADAMEISPQQLQQYISGRREPGSRILVKLLRLGCDVNWLLGGSESLETYRIYKLELEIKKLKNGFEQIHGLMKNLNIIS